METNISFFHIVCIISTFLSVSMGMTLVLVKADRNKANIFLGFLLLTYSLFFLPVFFDAINILEKLPHIIRLNFFSGTLVGPLTYLYCKSSIHKDSLSLKKNILHFIPFVISLYFFWPTLIKSGPEKLAIYSITITEGRVPEPGYIIFIMSIISILYTIFSINLVRKYLGHIKNLRSNIDPSFHRWLLFLSTSLLFPIIAVMLISLTGTLSVIISIIILSSFIVIVYGTLTLKPKFFYDLPDQILDSPDDQIKPKYYSSNLQDTQKEKYQSRIIDYMLSDKPFLDPEFTISQFSNQLNIPSNHVSQIINEKLNINFLDFVNKYRVEEAKTKLKDEKMNHYTIVTIAFDSGFNSKTAFYSAFKKHVGSTPSQYRKENQINVV